MKRLLDILENIDRDTEVIVTFDYGDSFGISNCCHEHESVYDDLGRNDLIVCDIVSLKKVSSAVWRAGSAIEFSLGDVVKVEDPANGSILFQKNVDGKI